MEVTMFKRLRYRRWKREALKAIREGNIAVCALCGDPIVPNDFVGGVYICGNGEEREVLVHAGYHSTLTNQDAFCTTGAIGIGYWSKKGLLLTSPSVAQEAMEKKAPVSRSY
ncbi:MAG TPA: hypothetical protein VJB56_03115 [Candidatus Paceibacterota bacterium]